MKVGDLKRLLEGVPDDLPVLISNGPDHSYFQTEVSRNPVATVGIADNARRGPRVLYLEWYGETHASPGEYPAKAFVIHHGSSR